MARGTTQDSDYVPDAIPFVRGPNVWIGGPGLGGEGIYRECRAMKLTPCSPYALTGKCNKDGTGSGEDAQVYGLGVNSERAGGLQVSVITGEFNGHSVSGLIHYCWAYFAVTMAFDLLQAFVLENIQVRHALPRAAAVRCSCSLS